MYGSPRYAARLEMAARCPARRCRIPSSTASMLLATPIKLTLTWAAMSSAWKAWADVSLPIPALATSRSVGPSCTSSWATAVRKPARSVTSATAVAIGRPFNSAASLFERVGLAVQRRDVRPRSARSNASCRPMPLPAPVMSATRLANGDMETLRRCHGPRRASRSAGACVSGLKTASPSKRAALSNRWSAATNKRLCPDARAVCARSRADRRRMASVPFRE